jgi:DNA-binding beta-propeller fold protein YncE
MAFDGTNIWVSNADDSTVTELSPTGATLGTFATVTFGTGPDASLRASETPMAFDGTHMWLVNRDGTIMEL